MSLLIHAIHRREVDFDLNKTKMTAILGELVPEALRSSFKCDVRQRGNHIQGTRDVPDYYPRRGVSLCLGKLYDASDQWWQLGSGVPDGSFAIVRDDGANGFEAVSDPAGSRMLWFFHDDDLFVVSNSERAITMYTGQFEFNRAVIPWVLSTGTRGLGASYSRDLHLLPPDSSVRLDALSWTLEVHTPEIHFAEVTRSHKQHLEALDSALEQTFASFNAEDARHSIISLSGGCDSRALAVYLARNRQPRWRSFVRGSSKAAMLPNSDVSVANKVAEALGLDHRHLAIGGGDGGDGGDGGEVNVTALLERFVLGGEGRHDHMNRLGGGGDQLTLRREGYQSIVRGDEGFGWNAAATPLAVRHSMELLLCADIANLRPHLAAFGLQDQSLPGALRQRDGESLQSWRDRLYHTFRLPTVLAALTEHKSAFFDVVNPLLSRRSLDIVRSLPDSLRTDKALFRELVAEIGPQVEFSGREGAPVRVEALRNPKVRRFLREKLASEAAERLFGRRLARWLFAEIHPARRFGNRAVHAAKNRLRRRLRRGAAAAPDFRIDPLRLAFRAYIAIRMVEQLEADAGFSSKLNSAAI